MKDCGVLRTILNCRAGAALSRVQELPVMSLRGRTASVAISCRNYRHCTNLFVCAVHRFAVGTPGRRALRIVYRTLTVGRDDLGAPRAGTFVFSKN